MEPEGDWWSLVSKGGLRTYQRSRTEGSVSSTTTFPTTSVRPPCACPVRQHVDSLSFESPGWHQASCMFTANSQDPQMVSGLTGFIKGNVSPRIGQSSGRCSVQRSTAYGQMEASPGCGAADLATVRQGRGRSICLGANHALPLVVCEDQPIGTGCISSRVAELPILRVPSFSTSMGDPTLNIPVQTQGAFSGTLLASQTMVSSSSESVTGRTVATSHQTGPPFSAERPCLAPRSSSSSALGLASGSTSQLTDCEPAALNTIGNARAPSTRQLYAARWRIFSSWCGDQGFDPIHCTVPKVGLGDNSITIIITI